MQGEPMSTDGADEPSERDLVMIAHSDGKSVRGRDWHRK
jgi:hypothetical protein